MDDNYRIIHETYNNSTNNIDHLTSSQYQLIIGFKIFSSTLSLIGSLFIELIYIYLSLNYRRKKKGTNHCKPLPKINDDTSSPTKTDYKNLKLGYGHTLIFNLSLADLILSISGFIKTSGFNTWSGEKSDISSSCILQGVLSNFSELSSICWTSMISLSIYLGTVTTNYTKIKKIIIYSFFYSYGIPLILTIFPLFTESYGPAGAWCWLNTRDSNDPAAWGWSLTTYIFSWINIIFNIFAVMKCIRYFKIRAFEVEVIDNEQANFLKNFCIVLKFFPIIQILSWIFPTINRIYIYTTDKENTVLYSLHAFFGFLTGFLNFIVYSYYYRSIIPIWNCLKKHDDMKENREENIQNNADGPEFIQNITEEEIEVKIQDKSIEMVKSVNSSENKNKDNYLAERDSIL